MIAHAYWYYSQSDSACLCGATFTGATPMQSLDAHIRAHVGPPADTPDMSPTRAVQQLLTARRNGTVEDYRDTCASIAALATHSNVNATARLLELLTDAAAGKGNANE